MAQDNGTPVYEWTLDGRPMGCGTRVELAHWKAEGVEDRRTRLGKIVGHEDPAADEHRLAEWQREAA